MSRIMVIAGGTWQCPIVKLAKNKGHFVICSNLYEDSPAFKYADVGVVANVLNKEKNLEYARQYNPDAVLTEQSDIAVTTVAYVAEQMGLKGITSEIAERFTNKYLMRNLTEKAGFVSPKHVIAKNVQEAKNFKKKVPKCIMKPLDSQSSRGVHIINDENDCDRYFEDSIHYSICEKAVVIEEYIEGTEFTVDGLKTEDNYIVTAISEKEHYKHNPNVANRLYFSPCNEKYDYEELKKINTEIVKTLGLPFGLTHAEYKYMNGNFYLIEIAARGGGTRISSDIVPIVSGINTNEVLLDILLNKKNPIKVGQKHEYAVLGFFDFTPGLITDIQGLDEASCIPGVIDVQIEVKVGETLGLATDDRSRCGYYLIYGDTKTELEQREAFVKETVRVVTK